MLEFLALIAVLLMLWKWVLEPYLQERAARERRREFLEGCKRIRSIRVRDMSQTPGAERTLGAD